MKSRRADGYYALRFRILERDQFTCQYCGQHAPDVILHVDHRLASSDGGTDDPDNLVTACSACNLGKEALRAQTDGKWGRLKRPRRQDEAAWEVLVRAEPRLLDLYREALMITDEGGAAFCANEAFFVRRNGRESLKNRIAQLVGWNAGYGYHETYDAVQGVVGMDAAQLLAASRKQVRVYSPPQILTTSAAYDLVYHKIYEALPDCRNCLCAIW